MAEVQVILSFLWAFYWPLLFIRLKGLYGKFDLTRNKLAACALVAAAVTTGSVLTNIAFFFPFSTLSLTMILSALAPIVALLLFDKASSRRTHLKLIILAAYFHIFWQLLPVIDAYPVAVDIAITALIFFGTRMKPPKRKKHEQEKQEHVSGSINDLWK